MRWATENIIIHEIVKYLLWPILSTISPRGAEKSAATM